jgi:hypothetical protein
MYLIAGFQPGILDDFRVVFESGAVELWTGGGADGWETYLHEQKSEVIVDLRTTGINGKNTGPNGSVPNGCYIPFYFRNPTTNKFGILFSRDIDWPAGVPSGYTHYRKSMFGFTVRGGRIVPQHIGNMPMCSIDYTPSYFVGSVTGVAGNINQWVQMSLAGYVPDNARQITFHTVLSGTPSPCFLTGLASADYATLCNYGGSQEVGGARIRIQGLGTYFAKVTAVGSRLDIYCREAKVTEFV